LFGNSNWYDTGEIFLIILKGPSFLVINFLLPSYITSELFNHTLSPSLKFGASDRCLFANCSCFLLAFFKFSFSSLANSEKSFITSSAHGTFELLGIAGECLGL